MSWIAQQPLPIPVTRRTMLVTVKQPWGLNNQPFRYNITLATYIRRFEVESCNDEYDPLLEDYCDERDEYFLSEGWYEIHLYHPEHCLSRISHEIVAIQPAPEPWRPDE